MQKFSVDDIRRSFVNASRSEVKAINFPADFDQFDWEQLDYLGWRDPKMPQRGYLVFPADTGLVGIALRAPEGGSGKIRKIICDLCRDVRSETDVYLYVARRAGHAGRDGNTVGTLICSDFRCSRNVRAEVSASRRHADWDTTRALQIEALTERTAKFVARVTG
ncbi:FBP domain-containing protein [Arthrobacter russicus]|uniref:Elongation factor G-binding protein C-terminal treble-clef zinc-finger domain-containing protein n=1 Tax=Arthrobacter russicus TaxID=172040 RepID=A0ABU1JCV5_9MICC|nr:FBP domain-containing protein [Arthrobacter russicus]MBQ1444950.1 FBP domain-containing protein [Renibacterium sp.]MDN5667002.1 FBP domain-containing protein [Renibacterium salmoninarum]MDR6269969.1 hypothetical protein [Arthrobacter russicus]